nr:helix-turn-helix domain-containing protein [Oculatellaceae cyanobacterium Prado106]
GWQPNDPVPSPNDNPVPAFYIQPCPEWLDPDTKLKKPRGWMDIWLEQKLIIKPPNLIPERMASLMTSKKRSPKKLKAASNPPLTGAEIKEARKEKGWTQTKLAGTLKVHQSLIAKIESGDRPISAEMETSLRRVLDL